MTDPAARARLPVTPDDPAVPTSFRASERPVSGAQLRTDVAAGIAARLVRPTAPLRAAMLPVGPRDGLPERLRGAIRSALASAGGELEIGVEPELGRLFFARSAIAWIVAPHGGERLSRLLRLRASVSPAALRRVVERCRGTGRSFVDVLVEEGLVSEDVVRATILEHNARQLAAILTLPDVDRVQFRPASRAYAGGVTFTLEEILACMAQLEVLEHGPVTSPVPLLPADRGLAETLARAMAVDGASAAAIIERASGEALAFAATDPGLDVVALARANVEVVLAEEALIQRLGLDGPLEDILVTVGTQYHLMRPLGSGAQLLFLAIDRVHGNLALARHELRELARNVAV